MEFSRCTGSRPQRESQPEGRSLKTQQRTRPCGPDFNLEVDMDLGESRHRTKLPSRAGRLRSKSSGFPRKEVIQPQLPLRLPCYDFTPIIILPSAAPSLRLGHRLRVLPTFVV